jgi:hypothetical protein
MTLEEIHKRFFHGRGARLTGKVAKLNLVLLETLTSGGQNSCCHSFV